MTLDNTLRTWRKTLMLAMTGGLLAATFAISPAVAQYYDDDDDNDRSYSDDRSYQDDAGQEPWQTANNNSDDVSFFYDELNEYGRWISHPDYGYVWTPARVDDEWRPYTRGNWVNTEDYGWYWVSDEPWGWATYHYGRWVHDDDNGWLWVPGSTWGPAWVAWRHSDNYVGWAPLPPDAYWDGNSGLRYDANLYEEPRFAFYWSFVEPRYISTPAVYRYVAPRSRIQTIIYRTRPATRYQRRGDRIVNAGISVDFFNRLLGNPLRTVRILASQGRQARGQDRWAGDTLRVWRPDLRRQYRAAGPRGRGPAERGNWANVDRRGGFPAATGRGPNRDRGQSRRASPQPAAPAVRVEPPASYTERPTRNFGGRDWGNGGPGRFERGAAPAPIVAPPAAVAPPASEPQRPARGGRDRDNRGGRPNFRDNQAAPAPAAPAAAAAPADAAPRRSGQRPDGARGQGRSRGPEAAQAPAPETPPTAAAPAANPAPQPGGGGVWWTAPNGQRRRIN